MARREVECWDRGAEVAWEPQQERERRDGSQQEAPWRGCLGAAHMTRVLGSHIEGYQEVSRLGVRKSGFQKHHPHI